MGCDRGCCASEGPCALVPIVIPQGKQPVDAHPVPRSPRPYKDCPCVPEQPITAQKPVYWTTEADKSDLEKRFLERSKQAGGNEAEDATAKPDDLSTEQRFMAKLAEVTKLEKMPAPLTPVPASTSEPLLKKGCCAKGSCEKTGKGDTPLPPSGIAASSILPLTPPATESPAPSVAEPKKGGCCAKDGTCTKKKTADTLVTAPVSDAKVEAAAAPAKAGGCCASDGKCSKKEAVAHSAVPVPAGPKPAESGAAGDACSSGVVAGGATKKKDDCCADGKTGGACASKKSDLPASVPPAAKKDDCCAKDGSCSSKKALPPVAVLPKKDDCCADDGKSAGACASKKAEVAVTAIPVAKKDDCCAKDGSCSSKKALPPVALPPKKDDCCADEKAGGACASKKAVAVTAAPAAKKDDCCATEKEGSCSKKTPVPLSKKDDCCEADGSCSSKKTPARGPAPAKKDDCCEADGSCTSKAKPSKTDGCSKKGAGVGSGGAKDDCCDDEKGARPVAAHAPAKKKDDCCDEGGGCSDEKEEKKKKGGCADELDLPVIKETKVDMSGHVIETFNISITGMTCVSCANSIEARLMGLAGVVSIDISFCTETAEVKHAPSVTPQDVILQNIELLGFGVKIITAAGITEISFVVPGSLVSEDRQKVQETLIEQLHAKSWKDAVGEGGTIITVAYEAMKVGARDIRDGLKATLKKPVTVVATDQKSESQTQAEVEVRHHFKMFLVALVLSIPVIILTIFFDISGIESEVLERHAVNGAKIGDILIWVFTTPVVFYAGSPIIVRTYKSLRYGRADTDVLVFISTMSAYFYSLVTVIGRMANPAFAGGLFFETSAFLVTLILFGRWLEVKARSRTGTAIATLLSMQSTSAVLITDDGSEETVDTALLHVGDIVKVLPGTRFPTDGEVTEGRTSVDEAMISGESMPVVKQPGDPVVGGSVNLDGAVRVRVTKLAGDSTLVQIVRMVRSAQSNAPSIQRVADKVSAKFIPTIIGIAAVVFIVWISLLSAGVLPAPEGAMSLALSFTIAVLIVACPCSVSLATPTAVMVGSTVAAKNGVLFKGGDVMEACAGINTVVFDKTGTLTRGKPEVAGFVALQGFSAEEMWFFVGSAEQGSEHVLARCIVTHAASRSSRPLVQPEDAVSEPGRGMRCTIAGREVLVGSENWLREYVQAAGREDREHYAESGYTVVCLVVDGVLAGVVALADALRPESKAAVAALHNLGVEVHMLSGDNEKTCRKIAAEAGVEHVHFGVLPDGKATVVEDLMKSGRRVMMVGDGTNDAPALATAHVGVAMGEGTDVAMESAKVVLMKCNLRDIVLVVDLGRVVMRRIKMNLIWAFGYNMCAIPFAAGCFYTVIGAAMPPAAAGFSELFSSVPVIVLSLLLMRYKPPLAARG